MSGGQHQPGDHVLVEAEYLSTNSASGLVRLLVKDGGSTDTIFLARPADVRPLAPAAPAPDTRDTAIAAVRALPMMEPATSALRDEDWADGYNEALAAAKGALFGASPTPDTDGWTVTEVEAAAVRVMVGPPRHDARMAGMGLGTPEERWAETPERDREHWRENARAVLDAAGAARVREEAARTAPAPVDDERVDVAVLAYLGATPHPHDVATEGDVEQGIRAALAADDAHRAGKMP